MIHSKQGRNICGQKVTVLVFTLIDRRVTDVISIVAVDFLVKTVLNIMLVMITAFVSVMFTDVTVVRNSGHWGHFGNNNYSIDIGLVMISIYISIYI